MQAWQGRGTRSVRTAHERPDDAATRRSPRLKRATGIEPALRAWKAPVQPQHFARVCESWYSPRAVNTFADQALAPLASSSVARSSSARHSQTRPHFFSLSCVRTPISVSCLIADPTAT